MKVVYVPQKAVLRPLLVLPLDLPLYTRLRALSASVGLSAATLAALAVAEYVCESEHVIDTSAYLPPPSLLELGS